MMNEMASASGDVTKAAARMHELAKMEDPPLRVALGSDAFGLVKGKLEKYTVEVRETMCMLYDRSSLLTGCWFE